MKIVLSLLVLFFATITADSAEQITVEFQRDSLNRATNVIYSTGFRAIYEYDASGNLTGKKEFWPAKILPVKDIRILKGQNVEVTFQVRHEVLPISDITVKATTSNPELVDLEGLVLSGNGDSRKLVITPKTGHVGNTYIYLITSDGYVGSTNSFQLMVR